MTILTRDEASARAALIAVQSYEVDLDLTTDPESFRSRSTVRFLAATPGASSFAEVQPERLALATLNGRPIDPGALAGNRLPLTGLNPENTLVVEADMAYASAGDGLHRCTDPADGQAYTYATSFPDGAQRVFACFDQPDLKAPVRLRVTADPAWTVIANGPCARSAPGRWECAATPPLPTYLVTVAAGPYHSVQAAHDGIPLGIYGRASLAPDLERNAGELLALTAACLDRLHELFGVRYPFGKYDQVFVPGFPAIAMENPGCVTIRDEYLFRSAPSEVERETRAVTIGHEMTHMWFGALVTFRWWDDLWLNESFAEYLGTRVTAEATEFRQAWTGFAIRRKLWGYRADQRPSTHPVAPDDVPDSASALGNLDGISYAKGSSVLRQLVAWLGDDAFFAGLRMYLARHARGNATLGDLFAALSAASGRDLAGWCEAWLRRAQVNTLAPVAEIDARGRYRSFAVHQAAPSNYPTLRPHRLLIGQYDLVGESAIARPPVTVDVSGPRTDVPALVGEPVADLILLNDEDLTYAKVRLDSELGASLPRVLPALGDPLARALVWGALFEAVRDAQRPATDLIPLAEAALPGETQATVLENVLDVIADLVDRHLPQAQRPPAVALLADVASRLLATTAPGDPRHVPAARSLIQATSDLRLLRRWLAGDGTPEGVAIDSDLRWRCLQRLAVLGAAEPAEITACLAKDRSVPGEQWAARCRASLPDAATKAAAWRTLIEDPSAPVALLKASADGFWQPSQSELTESYVKRYFLDMPMMAAARSPLVTERTADFAFPRYAVHPETRRLAADLLSRVDLHPGLRRAVTDADDELGRALAARAAFIAPA